MNLRDIKPSASMSYTHPSTGTAIDLTKQLATLDAGSYTLANGTEGQILYLALRSGDPEDVTVTFANIRILDTGAISTSYAATPFRRHAEMSAGTTMFCIFTNGAWTTSNGDI